MSVIGNTTVSAFEALAHLDPEFFATLTDVEWLVAPYVFGLLPMSSAPWNRPVPPVKRVALPARVTVEAADLRLLCRCAAELATIAGRMVKPPKVTPR